MGRVRARWIAGGALITLCACSGSIEPSGFKVPGQAPNQVTPWSPGDPNVPGGPGSPGAGSSAVAGFGGTGVVPRGGTGAGGTGATIPPNTSALRCVTPAVGPSPMRRLTHAEYDNAVRDLVGDKTHPAQSFAPDTQIGIFSNSAAAQTVPELLADQYLDAAVQLAEDIADVRALVGCDFAAATGGATCVQGFIGSFGRRAYRRPLATDEAASLKSLFDETSGDSTPEMGIRGVVAAVLASPNFLFRPEFGGSASNLANAKFATGFELSSRLASLIWASVPDDVLLDAAQNGELETREAVEAQARRMMADDRARTGIEDFYAQWFGLSLLDAATKAPEAYPTFNDALRNAMTEETRRFISHVLWEDDAHLSTMLTAPYGFANKPLADLYGVSGPTSATTFAKIDQDPAKRAGIVTQASLMTAFASSDESSPVKRGKWVRTRILCQDLPDPPANIPDLPAPAAGVSTRERFAMHTNNPACSGCHNLIDGLGFGLEAYDGIGRFRTTDMGVAVDSSGEVTATRDIDGAYMGGPELAQKLASSGEVRDCAPTQWLRYALGRREEADDTCSLVALRDAFAASGGDLRELMVALTQTDAFWNYRQAE